MPLTSINLYTLKQIRLARRRYDLETLQINSPRICHKVIEQFLALSSDPVEKFGIISMNIKHRILGIHIISVGNLEEAEVRPREVFAAALHNNAGAIIAFHNHPSGEVEPSKADIEITKKLKEAGELMNIRVLDHNIVGEGRFCSMKEKGWV